MLPATRSGTLWRITLAMHGSSPPSDSPIRKRIDVITLVRDQRVGRFAPLCYRRQGYAFRELGRDVFEGVDRNVDPTLQERLVELASEDVATVYDGERGFGVVVAGGPYDADFHLQARSPQPLGARFGLRKGELRAPRAEDHG